LRGGEWWAALRREPPFAPPDTLKFLTGQCRYSNDKAKRLLGWSPRLSLAEGMRRTEAWLRDGEDWTRAARRV
jgi:nucleoside-diphosphate-sugar epimerase